ncbi:exodeoxyribonuclease V subunit alpha [Micropruina sonneratiae]|uniref:exodeoxyribonuclease V subunit alpha n=1 Tax=Micropruina sonneratiae TaxID=2986940 RepID=UPI0022263AC5|nr:exodeoxyribonuclease V subunit alpha [Micropruina sp. KQZ13P-5]MCW3157476.1 exodeoxyribonuclease V subunit alpha [Micropruina sp. KQZ13P-5]
MRDPELSVVADDLVGEFHQLGVLDWADLHPARHLCLLYGENDPTVKLAVALAVRALRAGSVCLELDRVRFSVTGRDDELVEVPDELWPDEDAWRAALVASPLVALEPDGDLRLPVRLVGDRLYLTRYWEQEEQVRAALVERTLARSAAVEQSLLQPRLDELFGADSDPDQRRAVEHAATAGLTVLAGGPGTGKTTTIARMLAMLFAQGVRRVALAAPTGKAAARMDEALRGAAAQLPPEVAAWASGLSASTVHRLIGLTFRSRSTPRYHADNPLPHDAVIVDELSMVSLTQMAQLVDAVAPAARLVLVGDPDQLSSVSAGAVLADLTRAGWRGTGGSSPVVTLHRNYRFTGLLGDLASAVRHGDADRVLDLAAAGDSRLTLTPPDDPQDALRARVVHAGRAIHAAAVRGDADAALALLDRHRLLCAHRQGPFGATSWARQAEFWLRASVPGYGAEGEWFAGRAVLVTSNQADWGLWNGDTGVVLVSDGRPVVHFAGTERRALAPDLLGGTQSVDALTVHKSQGSQFAEVTLVVPPVESPLLTRELLYTAVTRATDAVHLIGTPQALAEAVKRAARRASGLRERL